MAAVVEWAAVAQAVVGTVTAVVGTSRAALAEVARPAGTDVVAKEALAVRRPGVGAAKSEAVVMAAAAAAGVAVAGVVVAVATPVRAMLGVMAP